MTIDGKIMTVNGPIDADDLGFVLTHEHVLVDFIGAEQAGKHRYDEDEAFAAILPHLEQAKIHGCTSFVECTPSYLGKDPMLLKRLAAATGMHLLTNTGYYGAADDRYVPAHAYGETADQLAKRWVDEFNEGIDGTGVRPGFIKIGVDPRPPTNRFDHYVSHEPGHAGARRNYSIKGRGHQPDGVDLDARSKRSGQRTTQEGRRTGRLDCL
jgi:predicted metal-dependent phosphotriesterase family hydrolase